MYQFFALHALHQSLKEMDGIALAEVEGFLDGCDDVSFHSIRKTAVEELQYTMVAVTRLKRTQAIKHLKYRFDPIVSRLIILQQHRELIDDYLQVCLEKSIKSLQNLNMHSAIEQNSMFCNFPVHFK